MTEGIAGSTLPEVSGSKVVKHMRNTEEKREATDKGEKNHQLGIKVCIHFET